MEEGEQQPSRLVNAPPRWHLKTPVGVSQCVRSSSDEMKIASWDGAHKARARYTDHPPNSVASLAFLGCTKLRRVAVNGPPNGPFGAGDALMRATDHFPGIF
ncbi:hypothetical protein MRX96_016843 [Rhipicephalus microplus]